MKNRISKQILSIRKKPLLLGQILFLISIFIGFAMITMCHSTVTILGPAMLDDPTLGLNKSKWAKIIAWGSAAILIGKLGNGILADRYGGSKVFMFSIILCLLGIVTFGVVSNIRWFLIAYFAIQFAKSAVWPSIAQLTRIWCPLDRRAFVWGILSSSSRSSTVFTSLVLGGLLLFFPWRGVIIIPAIITAILGVPLYFILQHNPLTLGKKLLSSSCELDVDEVQEDSDIPFHHLDQATLQEALIHFVTSSRFWLICISVMSLTVMMEFGSCFIPIYLKEVFQLTPSKAVVSSSLFPIGSLISVMLGGYILDKLNKRTQVLFLGGMGLLATCCIFAIMFLPTTIFLGSCTFSAMLTIIFLYGLMVAPCYYIPMSLFSVDFGGKRCGLLVCAIDVAGYGAAVAFGFLGQLIFEKENNWSLFFTLLLAISTVGALALIFFLILDQQPKAESRVEQSVIT